MKLSEQLRRFEEDIGGDPELFHIILDLEQLEATLERSNKQYGELYGEKIKLEAELEDYKAGNKDLMDGVAQLEAEVERLRKQYNELILAVGYKHEGETRHETALRYILEAEQGSNVPQQADALQESEE